MRELIKPFDPGAEFFIPEGCYINELANSAADPVASIARARLPVGATTRWHRLAGITERYIILEGRGRVEVGNLPPTEVTVGDVVLIPPGWRQRLCNLGTEELIFLAVCTPRFVEQAYEDIDPADKTS